MGNKRPARVPLYPASETNFFLKAVGSPLTLVRKPQGEVSKFILHFNGHTAEAVKLKGPHPSQEDFVDSGSAAQ